MRITKAESFETMVGPEDWFAGGVKVQMLFTADEPGRATGARVTFEPGARTSWHAHPYGQTLIITDGSGRVQRWGGPIERVGAGDVVWFPAGEKHWHGAAPGLAMTHLAIQEHQDGVSAEWMEHVDD